MGGWEGWESLWSAVVLMCFGVWAGPGFDWLAAAADGDAGSGGFGAAGDDGTAESLAAFLASALGGQDGADHGGGGGGRGRPVVVTAAAAGRYLAHATLLGKSRSFVIGNGGQRRRLLVPLVDFVNHLPAAGGAANTTVQLTPDAVPTQPSPSPHHIHTHPYTHTRTRARLPADELFHVGTASHAVLPIRASYIARQTPTSWLACAARIPLLLVLLVPTPPICICYPATSHYHLAPRSSLRCAHARWVQGSEMQVAGK